jgi:NAD(P)-dependent dehydrogenase (short-subunit alcohol dehydrogenase family)
LGLNDKVALITGGASGIGKASALALGRDGARVCVCDRDAEAAERAAREIGKSATAWQMDVADSGEVAEVFAHIEAEVGPVAYLVTAAGVPGHGLVSQLSDEVWRNVISVNLDGVFYCMREAVKQMLRAGHGCIVNISSICGMMGCRTCPAYSASKAGVIGISKSVARRHTEDGIRVNVVAPGLVDTPFVEPDRQMGKLENGIKKIPMGRMGTPEEIADLVAFLCGDSAAFITGQVISPNGGQLI